MKALEELTADIREKLPRLKELENGQKIVFLVADIPNSIYTGDIEIIGETATLLTNGGVDIGGYEYNSRKHFEIIGKDPMLNDVLEWHAKYVSNYSHFEVHDRIGKNNKGPIGVFLYYGEDEGTQFYNWDLSKPYLKDQSAELIKFLHGLIHH